MSFIDHPSQARDYMKPFPDKLHVVAVLNNFQMWHKRLVNWRAFEKRIEDSGGILYVVELALGGREFEVVDPKNPRHLGLRTVDEMWHKERMVKLAIRYLVPNDARYVGWFDGDIAFAKANICQEILQALQHHYIVQPFSHAIDLGPNDEPLWTTPGFMHEWVNHGALHPGGVQPFKPLCYYDMEKTKGWSPISQDYGKDWKICHPGLAWAMDLEIAGDLDEVIFDYSIYGSGDWVMALAWVGLAEMALAGLDVSKSRFAELVMDYQTRCEAYLHKDVGYVPGAVYHYWHGKKADRRYALRPNAILVELGYDPRTDIKHDRQGLYVLNTSSDPRSQKLRDMLRYFAKVRNEDSEEV
jgi:hypothetical protein